MVVDNTPFQTSLSAFNVWLDCQQKYYYTYVRRLRKKSGDSKALTLGNILHAYLELYYAWLTRESDAVAAHESAQKAVRETYTPELRGLANVAHAAGDTSLAEELMLLPMQASELTQRYFEYRGKEDAERYEVLRVEDWLKFFITPQILTVGKVDLVTRDRTNGHFNIWEHKSTGNVPPDGVRLRDFQTVLYKIQVRQLLEIVADTINWNYIYTKEPEVPELVYKGTKRQAMSRKQMTTTWATYARAVEDAGLSVLDYQDMFDKLKDAEETTFFPRYELLVLTDEQIMMSNYITGSEDMRQNVEMWKSGYKQPVRNISRSCEYCDFKRVCEAAITGGDEEDVIRMSFNEKPTYKGNK